MTGWFHLKNAKLAQHIKNSKYSRPLKYNLKGNYMIILLYTANYIWQTHRQHCSNSGKIEGISYRIWNETRVPTLSTLIQYSTWSLNFNTKTKKVYNQDINRKRRSQITLIYIHDSKKFYGLLQETFISDIHFWKCCRIQNQHAKISYLLYTNKKLKKEIRENIPFPRN